VVFVDAGLGVRRVADTSSRDLGDAGAALAVETKVAVVRVGARLSLGTTRALGIDTGHLAIIIVTITVHAGFARISNAGKVRVSDTLSKAITVVLRSREDNISGLTTLAVNTAGTS